VETSRLVRTTVLLAGALCLLAPASAVGATHGHRAHSERVCRHTPTHGRARVKKAGKRAHRAGSAQGCSGKTRTHHSSTGHHSPTHHVSHTTHATLPIDGEACQDTTLVPTEANIELVLQATLCLINRERTHSGERPLRANTDLESSAQSHSTSMAVHGYFEHVSPGGSTPLSRMRESGYLTASTDGYEVGENIAWGSYDLSTPSSIVAAWMASPPHRANILRPTYRDTGIGISPHLPSSFAEGETGAIYTQDFGVILGP
jgi:uncharacterized protein YkwD